MGEEERYRKAAAFAAQRAALGCDVRALRHARTALRLLLYVLYVFV